MRFRDNIRPTDLGIGSLFEKVRDAVVVAEAETQRMILWNPAAERLFGYSASEAMGLRVEVLVPDQLKEDHRTGIARYAKRGHGSYIDSDEPLELPALRKDEQQIWVELSLSPIEPEGAEDGDGRFVLAIVRDITERKRAEEAHARLAAIVESSDDAILGKTLEGIITSWNQGAERIYGYSAEEAVGRPITMLTPPERAEEIPEILQKIRQGERVDHYETVRLRKDGTRIDVSITVSPIRDSKGNVVGASIVARDVTEGKRAEEEIRRLNETLERRVEERTAQLAESKNELRNLLGKLLVAQEEERRRVAYEIHDGLTQMVVAIHHRLQVFADAHPPNSEEGWKELGRALNLAQRTVIEARHVIEGLRPTALDDFGLAVAVRQQLEELEREGWQITYEEGLGGERLPNEVETALYRVAQEALTNARKHAGAAARVRVVLRRCAPERVRLEVADEGRGFDPSASSQKTAGSGEKVGLSSMRERVALLGGELRVESSPGMGTTVIAEVPLPGHPSNTENGHDYYAS